MTDDLPRYFALVTKIKEEKRHIGGEGGVISSTVVPQVQAVFPEGALTKKIKVGLQVGSHMKAILSHVLIIPRPIDNVLLKEEIHGQKMTLY